MGNALHIVAQTLSVFSAENQKLFIHEVRLLSCDSSVGFEHVKMLAASILKAYDRNAETSFGFGVGSSSSSSGCKRRRLTNVLQGDSQISEHLRPLQLVQAACCAKSPSNVEDTA